MEIDRKELLRNSLSLKVMSARNTLRLLLRLRRILKDKSDPVLTESDRRGISGCLKAVKSMLPKDLHQCEASFTLSPDETVDTACSRVEETAGTLYMWYCREKKTLARSYNPL